MIYGDGWDRNLRAGFLLFYAFADDGSLDAVWGGLNVGLTAAVEVDPAVNIGRPIVEPSGLV